MIDHTGVSASDFAASAKFYDAAFAALGGAMIMKVPVEHTGGIQVLMTDGAVRFISENIDLATQQNLAHIADGNAVGEF